MTEPDHQERANVAYTWTVTAFYVVAIGANLWILWKTYGDGLEAELAKRRVTAWWHRVTKPIRERRELAKAAKYMQYEAYVTVTDVDPTFGVDTEDDR